MRQMLPEFGTEWWDGKALSRDLHVSVAALQLTSQLHVDYHYSQDHFLHENLSGASWLGVSG